MYPKWRRMRTIVTIVMTVIGAGLITAAWFGIGVVRGEAVANLAFLGLVLPIGFYAVWTMVGWQRSADSGIAPGRVVALCLRLRLGFMAPIIFMMFLVGLTQNLSHALDRPLVSEAGATTMAASAFDASAMRRGCVTAMTNQVRAKGGDIAASRTRVDSYCGCLTVGVQTAYTPKELETLPDEKNPMQDPRFSGVVQQCMKQM